MVVNGENFLFISCFYMVYADYLDIKDNEMIVN